MEEAIMTLLDTAQIVREGQFKSTSALQVFWLTRFKGCKVVNTLHTPKRNLIGNVSTSKVWIMEPSNSNASPL
jgi:hypothetical protein